MPDEFCKNEDCAYSALNKMKAILKDPSKPIPDRREALFFIVHILGDLHQPLHCAERNNDRGGNLVRVHLPSDSSHVTNLHRVWDTDLVEEAMSNLSMTDFVNRLANGLSMENRKAYRAGTLEQWIIESHMIAREKVYKDKGKEIAAEKKKGIHQLSVDYVNEGAEIVEGQLLKGGVRLAQFLNDTLKD